jgi:hypothetical protein
MIVNLHVLASNLYKSCHEICKGRLGQPKTKLEEENRSLTLIHITRRWSSVKVKKPIFSDVRQIWKLVLVGSG